MNTSKIGNLALLLYISAVKGKAEFQEIKKDLYSLSQKCAEKEVYLGFDFKEQCGGRVYSKEINFGLQSLVDFGYLCRREDHGWLSYYATNEAFKQAKNLPELVKQAGNKRNLKVLAQELNKIKKSEIMLGLLSENNISDPLQELIK